MPKYKIYGKSHLEGTSRKTGRDYNFHVIHTLGRGRGVEGFEAKQINLDGRAFSYDDLRIGILILFLRLLAMT